MNNGFDKGVLVAASLVRPRGSATVAELRRLSPRIRRTVGISELALQWLDAVLVFVRLLMDSSDSRPLTERLGDLDEFSWLPPITQQQVTDFKLKLEQPGYIDAWIKRWNTQGGPRTFLRRAAGAGAAQKLNDAIAEDRDLLFSALKRGVDALMPIAHAVDSCGQFGSTETFKKLFSNLGTLVSSTQGQVFVEMNFHLTEMLNKVGALQIEDLLAGDLKDVITGPLDSGKLRATLDRLSAVVSSDARERISTLSDGLLRKIQGASDALYNSADGVSQAANSLIELIDRLLRAAAPKEDVLRWLEGSSSMVKEIELTYVNNGEKYPTKQGEALFFISGGRHISECETDLFARYIADGLSGARRALQKLKHSDSGDEQEKDRVWRAALAIEGFISYALRVGWYYRSDAELDELRKRLAGV